MSPDANSFMLEKTASMENPVATEGPDLNSSKSPYDKKEYRQIMLANGLRVVLISDTVAMTQSYNSGGIFMEDGDDDDEDDDDSDVASGGKHRVDYPDVDADNDNDSDDCSGDDNEEKEDGESHDENRGLRNAAAAMVVGVGSMSDPPECQGLAHFLEHLLFMGSTKYPGENEYDAYINKHGGNNNAYTELEYTVYHFDIAQEYLAKALDIFAQFFTSPLMLESSIDRELNSVEAEFQLAKNSDGSRCQHLMSHTCGYTPSEHPFAKFSWGNLESLREAPKRNNIDPLVELRKFYDKFYYASNMRLVIIGGYSLDVLQEHAIKSFSDITSKGLQSFSWDIVPESPFKNAGMPFTIKSLGKIYYVAPVKDRHELSVTWQIPSQHGNWKSKPGDYLAHLIGHEAQGSVFAALKARSWVTACCAGVGAEGYENASSHALFSISFSLSEEGIVNWREVVSMVYQYIGLLRYHCREGLPMWIYEELRSIQEVSYRYDDEQSPEEFVESLADELAPTYALPPERLLDGTSLLFGYDPECIQHLVDNYFNPGNARIDILSSTLGRSSDYEAIDTVKEGEPMPPSDSLFNPTSGAVPPCQEPIFGTYFWCEELSASQKDQWHRLAQPQLPLSGSMLALPFRNHFIPTNFSLRELPPSDCDHPLLNCCIKLQIAVGKRKEWFTATVTRYNSLKNQILLSYEDEDEKWHQMDVQSDKLTLKQLIAPDFEGTLDNRKHKYRIVALAIDGEGALRRFGDESDFDAEDGLGFPPIPPAPLPSHLPKLVCNTQMLKLWHLQDRRFKRPIAELRVLLHCAKANQTPLYCACADLLVYLISDALTEVAYLASVCELGSSFAAHDSGFSMRVHGFDDKLLDLFSVMLDLLMQFRGREDGSLPEGIKADRFDLCLETYRRHCNNGGMKASKLATDLRIRCLRPTSWSSHQKLVSIKDIDVVTFAKVISNILENIGVEAIFHGNIDAMGAKRAQDEIMAQLSKKSGGGLPRKKYPQQVVLRIPQSSYTLKCPAKDPTDPNTAVELYFQVGKDNTRDRVMVDLLMEMMYEPLYDQIRTKDQFGYHVSCDCRWTNGVIGMHFQVVTSSKTAQEAEERLEKFIRDYRQTLVDMKPPDFIHHLVALSKRKLDMFNSLPEETNHYWNEIREGRYHWDVDREEVICLRSVTKEETLKAYDEWLSPETKTRRRVAIQVIRSEGDASAGKPDIANGVDISEYNDACVQEFHTKHCKNQTFGRIY